jgi:hypothetical protein
VGGDLFVLYQRKHQREVMTGINQTKDDDPQGFFVFLLRRLQDKTIVVSRFRGRRTRNDILRLWIRRDMEMGMGWHVLFTNPLFFYVCVRVEMRLRKWLYAK